MALTAASTREITRDDKTSYLLRELFKTVQVVETSLHANQSNDTFFTFTSKRKMSRRNSADKSLEKSCGNAMTRPSKATLDPLRLAMLRDPADPFSSAGSLVSCFHGTARAKNSYGRQFYYGRLAKKGGHRNR